MYFHKISVLFTWRDYEHALIIHIRPIYVSSRDSYENVPK